MNDTFRITKNLNAAILFFAAYIVGIPFSISGSCQVSAVSSVICSGVSNRYIEVALIGLSLYFLYGSMAFWRLKVTNEQLVILRRGKPIELLNNSKSLQVIFRDSSLQRYGISSERVLSATDGDQAIRFHIQRNNVVELLEALQKYGYRIVEYGSGVPISIEKIKQGCRWERFQNRAMIFMVCAIVSIGVIIYFLLR